MTETILTYELQWTLTGVHTDSVTGVAISPTGDYIATCSLDMQLVIWSLKTGKALHNIIAQSPVLSIIWTKDSGPGVIVAGTADGTLLTVSMSSDSLSVVGTAAHEKPIECIAVPTSAKCLASGAHDDVTIWSWKNNEVWERVAMVAPPRPNSYSGSKPICVTSLHWLPDQQTDECLVASYLFHGVYGMKVQGGVRTTIWSIHLPLCGSCSVLPSRAVLAVCNIRDGFEVYRFPAGSSIVQIPITRLPDQTAPLPLKYAHGGSMLICAGYDGKVRLVKARSGRHWQTLEHKNCKLIQSLDAYDDKENLKFLIACGGAEDQHPGTVYTWNAKEVPPKEEAEVKKKSLRSSAVEEKSG